MTYLKQNPILSIIFIKFTKDTFSLHCILKKQSNVQTKSYNLKSSSHKLCLLHIHRVGESPKRKFCTAKNEESTLTDYVSQGISFFINAQCRGICF